VCSVFYLICKTIAVPRIVWAVRDIRISNQFLITRALHTQCDSDACLIIRLLCKMESTSNHKLVADSNIDARTQCPVENKRNEAVSTNPQLQNITEQSVPRFLDEQIMNSINSRMLVIEFHRKFQVIWPTGVHTEEGQSRIILVSGGTTNLSCL